MKKRKRKNLSLLCECNCGESAEPGNRFINGHNARGSFKSLETRRKMSINNGRKHKRKHLALLCFCGCGLTVKPGKKYIHGHNGKGKVGWSKGLTKKNDIRVNNHSKAMEGGIPWNKGRESTEEEKKKTAEVSKRYFIDHPEALEAIRKRAKIRAKDPKIKEKISNTVASLWQDSEYRKKLRLSHTERIKRQGCSPSYNEIACGFFAKFDRDFNTQGQYATNKEEYYIKALGYWVDYINFDLKLIIEWDEDAHYDADGNLRKRDLERQKEIQEHFSDFIFVRLRQKEIVDFDIGFDLINQEINLGKN